MLTGKLLQGKVAVVTGSSSGIGKAIAHRLAKAGASVVLAARRVDKLEEVKQAIEKDGGKAIAVKTDMVIRQQVRYTLPFMELRSFTAMYIYVNIGSADYICTGVLQIRTNLSKCIQKERLKRQRVTGSLPKEVNN